MASGIALLVISVGAIVAGWGSLRTVRRMRSVFLTTRGRVVARELGTLSDTREAVWGKGGGYYAKPTYTYTVGSTTYTSNLGTYSKSGYKKAIAEQQLAAIPEEVDVHYDPDDPQTSYLRADSPWVGRLFITGGSFGVLVGLVLVLAAA